MPFTVLQPFTVSGSTGWNKQKTAYNTVIVNTSEALKQPSSGFCVIQDIDLKHTY